ncbi:YciI family protein [Kribbella sp. NPDC056951]|uniref:YciI family protein n=1 Tax=Kribbella sp. NPDC056951 TaxID=3345978 RepID=UPI0036418C37
MRYVMMMRASAGSEAWEQPSEQSLNEMTQVMAEMAEKGVLLAGEGLLPSSEGFRLLGAGGGTPRVVDGPFAETKELIAGFCLIEVESREEALMWAKRCFAADHGNTSGIELRRVATADDFGDNFTPEARAREANTFAVLDARRSED